MNQKRSEGAKGMGEREQRPSAIRLVVVTIMGVVSILLGTAIVTLAGPSAGADEAPPVASGRVEPGAGPVGITSPELTVQSEGPGADIAEAWASPWVGAGPRDEPNAIFDNGLPLDDWGDPASQLSKDPNDLAWRFVAAAAEDFILPPGSSPTADYHVTKVRAPFIFFNGNTTQTPANWLGIDVTIYANNALDLPSGQPLIDGTHAGTVIATQWVPQGPGLVLDPVIYLTCRKVRKVDITVDFRLPKGTRFWLSLVPRFNAPPQTAWCLSETQTSGLPAVRGASFGPPFWNPIEGNSNICSGSPTYHTRKNLSFQIYGEEFSTATGACCNLSTGVCVEPATAASCTALFDVYHGGAACAFVGCHIVTGACHDDATSTCTDGVNIANCQGVTQQFSAGQTCGACCLPNHTCVDLAPALCASQGEWHEGSCPGGPNPYYCPPINDECVNAITAFNGSTVFDTRGATTDGPAISPQAGCAAVNQDVWFKYNATCSGMLEISLCGASYNSAMAVYEGVCPALTAAQVACDDDGCGVAGGASKVVLPVTSGIWYLIRVGGVGLEMGTGTMTISCTLVPPGACCDDASGSCVDNVNIASCQGATQRFSPGQTCDQLEPPCGTIGACCLPDHTCQDLAPKLCTSQGGTWHDGSCEGATPYYCPPINDECVSASPAVNGSNPFDTRGASTDGPAINPHLGCAAVEQDVWFKYNAMCTGTLEISLCGASYNSAMAVYEGCDCPATAARQVACDDDGCGDAGGASKVVLPVTSGTCYLIRLGGVGAATGTGMIVITCTPLVDPTGACCHPAGDCEVVTELQCGLPGDVFHAGKSCSQVVCPVPPIHDCCVGDTNGDGTVDLLDIQSFVDRLFVWPEVGTVEFCEADINGDLKLDGLDVQLFVRKLMAGGPCRACCYGNGTCSVTLQTECLGTWTSSASCEPNPCCELMGDMNGDGAVNGLDIEGFVYCLLEGSPLPGTNCVCGDFNHNNVVDEGDITDFMAALGVPVGP
jgi:hypothetical protein